MRLFIAINFSEEIKKVLINAIDELRCQAVSGNFTRPENLHLTLAFIGESEDVAAIRKVIDSVPAAPFDIATSGAGHFGDLYWIGIEKNPQLEDLAENIRSELRCAGFRIEDRKFKPHITVARQLAANNPVSINVPKTRMTVSRISLMKSERIGGRLLYTEVYGRLLG